jgi:hypothetical protein
LILIRYYVSLYSLTRLFPRVSSSSFSLNYSSFVSSSAVPAAFDCHDSLFSQGVKHASESKSSFLPGDGKSLSIDKCLLENFFSMVLSRSRGKGPCFLPFLSSSSDRDEDEAVKMMTLYSYLISTQQYLPLTILLSSFHQFWIVYRDSSFFMNGSPSPYFSAGSASADSFPFVRSDSSSEIETVRNLQLSLNLLNDSWFDYMEAFSLFQLAKANYRHWLERRRRRGGGGGKIQNEERMMSASSSVKSPRLAFFASANQAFGNSIVSLRRLEEHFQRILHLSPSPNMIDNCCCSSSLLSLGWNALLSSVTVSSSLSSRTMQQSENDVLLWFLLQQSNLCEEYKQSFLRLEEKGEKGEPKAKLHAADPMRRDEEKEVDDDEQERRALLSEGCQLLYNQLTKQLHSVYSSKTWFLLTNSSSTGDSSASLPSSFSSSMMIAWKSFAFQNLLSLLEVCDSLGVLPRVVTQGLLTNFLRSSASSSSSMTSFSSFSHEEEEEEKEERRKQANKESEFALFQQSFYSDIIHLLIEKGQFFLLYEQFSSLSSTSSVSAEASHSTKESKGFQDLLMKDLYSSILTAEPYRKEIYLDLLFGVYIMNNEYQKASQLFLNPPVASLSTSK